MHSGLIVGEQPSETLALLRGAAAADRQAADRQADAERRRPEPDRRWRPRQGGADAVSLINTLKAAALDPASGEPWLGAGSRRPLRSRGAPVAVKQVADVAAAVSIPVVGMGGVESGADARDLLRAGADLVAVGTASFRDPLAAERIRAELERAGGLSAGVAPRTDGRDPQFQARRWACTRPQLEVEIEFREFAGGVARLRGR